MAKELEVARVADLPPGKMVCIEAGDRTILVANVDGSFYSTDDTCTHEDASLSCGFLRGELVKCPLHGSRFNVRTGEPMEEPAEEWLHRYPVQVRDGTVFVGTSPLPRPTGHPGGQDDA